MIKLPILLKALRSVLLPTLIIAVAILFTTFSVDVTMDFLSGNSISSFILRVIILLIESWLVYYMYKYYEREEELKLRRESSEIIKFESDGLFLLDKPSTHDIRDKVQEIFAFEYGSSTTTRCRKLNKHYKLRMLLNHEKSQVLIEKVYLD